MTSGATMDCRQFCVGLTDAFLEDVRAFQDRWAALPGPSRTPEASLRAQLEARNSRSGRSLVKEFLPRAFTRRYHATALKAAFLAGTWQGWESRDGGWEP